MPNALTGLRIRLPLIAGTRNAIQNKLTGAAVAIPRGNGVRLECAAFIADPSAANLVDDWSAIESVTMQCRADNATGSAIFDATVAIGDFDNEALTFEDWSANTDQHFTIALTAEETGQTMLSGKSELPIYLAFEAIPTSGDPIFLGGFTATIFEDGVGSSGSPVVGDPTYHTAAEADARYLQITNAPFRRSVVWNGSYTMAGLVGDWSRTADYLAIYTGDGGTTHSWLKLTGSNA